jgi:AcrR family transcriptional regulator
MSVQDRRAREKENLREEILDAARSLFAKEGYDSVSIRKIANQIEYSPGTIYLYFKDKSEIFNALCEEAFAKLGKKMRSIAEDKDSDPLERIRRAGRAYIEFAVENPNQYTVAFLRKQEAIDRGEYQHIEAGMQCFSHIRSMVQDALDAGLLRIADVDEGSQALWASVHGLAALFITCASFPFIEHTRLTERVLDMSIEGLRKK